MPKELKNNVGGSSFENGEYVMQAGGDGVISGTGTANVNWKYFNRLGFKGRINIPAATVLGTGTLGTLIYSAASGAPGQKCPKGYKPVVTFIAVYFSGTAWTSGTDIRVSDTSSSPVDFCTITAAAAVANAAMSLPQQGVIGTAISGVTMNTGLSPSVGGATEAGIIVRATGTFTAGTAFDVYVEGTFQKV